MFATANQVLRFDEAAWNFGSEAGWNLSSEAAWNFGSEAGWNLSSEAAWNFGRGTGEAV